MATSLDEQGVEEQEAWRRTSQQYTVRENVMRVWWVDKHADKAYLSEWVHCHTLHQSNSSSPHFLHLPTPEALVGCWSMSSVSRQDKSIIAVKTWKKGPVQIAVLVKSIVNNASYDGRFTWKKLSSLSLRIPSLSKSDTLKIRVRAFTQSGFIWALKKIKRLTSRKCFVAHLKFSSNTFRLRLEISFC